MFEEFKKFALRGNMLDLAVGVIIGTAFSSLVNSIVKDLFMPVLGLLTGGMDFSNIFWQMSGPKQSTLAAAQEAGATLAYGHFVTIAINFLIVSFVLFLLVKGLNKLQAIPEKEQKETTDQILTDIRAILERDLDDSAPKAAVKAIAKSAGTKTGGVKAKK